MVEAGYPEVNIGLWKPPLDGDPLSVAAVEVAGIRTLIEIPMLKEGELVGTIATYRKEVRPFTEKQIELVSNFVEGVPPWLERSIVARLGSVWHRRTRPRRPIGRRLHC